jgi:hypothetical protein
LINRVLAYRRDREQYSTIGSFESGRISRLPPSVYRSKSNVLPVTRATFSASWSMTCPRAMNSPTPFSPGVKSCMLYEHNTLWSMLVTVQTARKFPTLSTSSMAPAAVISCKRPLMAMTLVMLKFSCESAVPASDRT